VTQCPKCAAPVATDAAECPRCGIVFAKYGQRAIGPAADIASDPGRRIPSVKVRDPFSDVTRLARAGLLIGLILWTWQFARAPMGVTSAASVLHLPNLVFHEAGHVLFTPFGRFMTVLGGSLFQFALPLALAIVFVKQRNPFGAVVSAWWAGENLLDVAPYIADARALQLVLLGGRTGAEVQGHDWEYLLATLGWMRFDRTIGLGAHRLGLVIMIGALVWGAVYLVRNPEESQADSID
jgi:hypothetical protein